MAIVLDLPPLDPGLHSLDGGAMLRMDARLAGMTTQFQAWLGRTLANVIPGKRGPNNGQDMKR